MVKVLMVSPVVNFPEISGNSSRVNSVVKLLASNGYDVQFCLAETPFINSRYSPEIELYWQSKFFRIPWQPNIFFRIFYNLIILLKRFSRKFFNGKLREIIEDFNLYSGWLGSQQKEKFKEIVVLVEPDVVLFEYAILAEYKSLLPIETPTICDSHDAFAGRNSRLRESSVNSYWLNMTIAQERLLLDSFDFVWAIQKNEKLFFENIVGVSTQVFTMDITEPAKCLPFDEGSFINSPKVGFISSYNPQNKLGLDRFLEEVWPEVVKVVPNARFLIAGSICKYLAIEEKSVDVIGRVNDLAEFYSQCMVVVNPVVGGSGLKIKTVEALAHGRCVVSSIDGAEGLDYIDTDALTVVDEYWSNFSSKLIGYIKDEKYLRLSAEKATKAIDDRYSENKRLLRGMLS